MVFEKNDLLHSHYAGESLTYTGEVATALGLVSDQVKLSLGDQEFPCGLHASSFTEATLLLKVPASVWSWVAKTGPEASLTLAFQAYDSSAALSLFRIPGRWTEVKTHITADQSALVIVLFEFTRVPPRPFIELQGGYLENRSKAAHRREARLRLTPQTIAGLGIRSLTSSLWVDDMERLCVLRELSFGGSQLVLSGRPGSLLGKKVVYLIPLTSSQDLKLKASVVRAESAQGQAGFAVLGLKHELEALPRPFQNLLAGAEAIPPVLGNLIPGSVLTGSLT